MVQPASIARLLPALPTRPPTPPRESENTGTKPSFFRTVGLYNPFFSQTPPATTQASSVESPKPASSTASPNPASSRRSVKWSLWNEYKEPPTLSVDGQPVSQPNLQPLASSIDRKPKKSILKPYNGPIPQDYTIGTNSKLSPPHTFPNLATMLESVAQQLAGKDRSSRMDAYMSLSGVLRASDNVPDIRALKNKMGLLEQFIQRDMSAKNTSGQSDAVLIIQALLLLSSFLPKPAIAELLSPDFSTFVVDHAIKALDDATVSKDIIKHLMFIMAQQDFSSKIMNADRVGKLIRAMHDIEKHVKGRSIILGRINVYRNLLRGSRSHMVNNSEWIEDLFQDMLSNTKEIRVAAVTFGLEAAFLLGTEAKVSRAVSELFLRGLEDNLKFADYYAKRLKTMVEKKQDVATVPQIWSVSVLFLRSRPRQFEHWAFFKLWLQILQMCFNTSDLQAKVEANCAWNHFIYAIQPDEKTSPTTIKRLSQPLLGQLKRKNVSKSGSMKRARQSAISSFCTLLYYTLKPYSTPTQLDLFWDEYVTEILRLLTPVAGQENLEVAEHDVGTACAILTGLFNSSTPRPWDDKRATNPDLMKANELPALDPKWVRKNAARIFSVLEPLLERMFWQLTDEKSAISILWRTYLASIALPAAKEVKVSLDTMACLASIFNMLYKLWHKGPKGIQTLSSGGSPEFLASISLIISTTVSELGLLPFTEKLLSIGQQDTFIVIATPSHRPDKVRGIVKCPLHHLFVLFTSESPGLQYDGCQMKVVEGFLPLNFRQVISGILSPFFDARTSSKMRMDLVNDLLQLLPNRSTDSSRFLWRVLADFATSATDIREDTDSSSNGSNDYPLGADYRKIVNVLEMGIEISPLEALPGWKSLFQTMVTRVSTEAGDAGRAIAVIEPLARTLLPKLSSTDQTACGMSYCQLLISKTTYPRDRQALDAARRRLWGTANVGPKTTTFDPYSHLYDYICLCLTTAYMSFSEGIATSYSNLLSAVADLIKTCPSLLFQKIISRLQKGAALWIVDANSHFSSRSLSEVSQAVANLWSMTCSRIPQIARQTGYPTLLNHMQLFICSGLESKHRSVVNMAIETWNTTFGCSEEELEYSHKLTKAFLRLRPITDLNLPFFPKGGEEQGATADLEVPQFSETQNDSFNFGSNSLEEFMIRQRTPQRMDRSPLPQLRSSRVLLEASQSTSRKHLREETPETGKRKAAKRNLTPKLRHDDSQIQFEPIESSPLAEKVLDSQLLTDRQKEVKERQQAEAAAMFPDIRSSPRSKSRSTQKTPTASGGPPLLRPGPASHNERTSEERQTTPTFMPATDFDDFITSSPTPTRSVRSDREVSAPQSSPPQDTTEEETPDYLMSNDEDIPSSPPEMTPQSPAKSAEPENDTTISLDPSAQLDPYAVVHPSKLSTFENAEGQSPEDGPGHDSDQSEELVEPSNTPPQSPTIQLLKDVFVDAMSSPASSDKNTVDEDIFLDAISSPQVLTKAQKEVRKRTSSPISDLDESSIMRIMDEFDEGSGRPQNQGAAASPCEQTFSPGIKEEYEQANALKSQASDNSDCIVVKIPKGYQVPRGPNSQRRSTSIPAKRSCRSTSVASSRQSSIPETPDTRRMSREAAIQDSPNLRVVIHLPPTRSSPRRRASTIPLSQGQTPVLAKKRKHGDIETPEDESEVPGSQVAPVEANKQNQSVPSCKKRKGRRSLPLSQAPNRKPEAGNSSQDIIIDDSMQNLERNGIPEATTKSGSPAAEIPVTTREGDYGSAFLEELSNDGVDIDIVAETTFDENSFEERCSTAEGKDKNPTRDVLESAPETMDEEMVESSPKPYVGKLPVLSNVKLNTQMTINQPAAEPNTTEFEIPVQESVAEKLQNIISLLGNASLSREDVNKLEDLFMDAKRKLYAAEARGREGV